MPEFTYKYLRSVWLISFSSFLVIPALLYLGCREWIPLEELTSNTFAPISGINFTAPRKEIPPNSFQPISFVKGKWVSLIPYAFCVPGKSEVNYNYPGQWWGESPEGIRKQVRYAQNTDLKIMIKPHIWVWGQGWPGEFTVDSEQGWIEFEEDYTEYILEYAHLAEELNVEMFCIGTEMKTIIKDKPELFSRLIKKIREAYNGKLVYAANWDNFQHIPFWDQLDYIGIDAYFPLSEEKKPAIRTLIEAWVPIKEAIESESEKWDKPVIFTEFGYLSVEGATGKNWELEGQLSSLTVDQETQKRGYEALFSSFWSEDWFHGGFLWKWYFNHHQVGGSKDPDYTPQNKPASETIAKWYQKSAQSE